MRLHSTNTLTRTKERFIPVDPDRVTARGVMVEDRPDRTVGWSGAP